MEDNKVPDDVPPPKRAKLKEMTSDAAIDKTTLFVLKETFDSSADKNVICSPLGVMSVLALLRSTASAGVMEELNSVLGGPGDTEGRDLYRNISEELCSTDSAVLTFCNKVCVSDEFTLTDEFKKAAEGYRCDISTIDFQDSGKAAANINAWVNRKTKGHIRQAVNPRGLSCVATALFNVIFFQGQWYLPFKKDVPKLQDFHLDKKTTVKKPVMQLIHPLLYLDKAALRYRMVELQYQEKGFSMLVVLPREIEGLSAVVSDLASTGVLRPKARLQASSGDIVLEMPKFDIDGELDLEETLRKMGVSKIFDEGATGVVQEQPVRVSKIFQKAFIKVDEEGAKAGACTFLRLGRMSKKPEKVPPPPVEFKVDRPFLYLIMYEGKILFAGTYSQ